MKAIASVAFGLVSVVGICIAGTSAASYVLAEPEHVTPRMDLRPNLWTHAPVQVIQASQHYERLPAKPSSYAEEELQRAAKKTNVAVVQPAPPAAETQAFQDTASSGHQEWCSAKYRSYDAATDTYRSFSGERRACVSPAASDALRSQQARRAATYQVEYAEARGF